MSLMQLRSGRAFFCAYYEELASQTSLIITVEFESCQVPVSIPTLRKYVPNHGWLGPSSQTNYPITARNDEFDDIGQLAKIILSATREPSQSL